MQEFSALVSAVTTMFLLLIIGFIARKLGYMDEKLSKGISNLIICVAQPFMIIGSIIGIPYSDENIKSGLLILGISAIVHTIAAVVAFFATCRFKDVDERRITEFGMIFANNGFLGFPILQAVFGDIGVFYGSFYIIVFNIVTWTYGMIVLGKARKQIKMNFKNMIINFGTTPCLIGIALFLLKVKFPEPLMEATNYMGSLCTPLSMLIIGGLLANIPWNKMFVNLKVYYQCLVRLIIVPLIVILVTRLLNLDYTFSLFAAILAAMPTAANTSMFAEKYDIKPEYSAHGVGMSTLFSAVTVPVMMLIAKGLFTAFGG